MKAVNDSFFLFLIATALMVFESKSYITMTYEFPCPDVVGNLPGRSVAIMPPFNSFQAIAPLTGHEKGSLFKGAYFPQKWDLLPPF
jgi:hypothetical protein